MVRGVVVTSLIDAVVADLKRMVLAKELEPGALLTEAFVSDHYDIARATAKAAIEHLVTEKVLTRDKHKTAQVITLGPDDVRDIYNTRIYLESEILRRLAARKYHSEEAAEANAEISKLWSRGVWDITDPDMRFHTALANSLNSPRTYSMYRSLAFDVQLCMSQLQGSQRLSPEIIIAEHTQLLKFVENGQGDEAVALLDEHLCRARELLAGMLGGTPGPEAFWPSSVLKEKSPTTTSIA